MRILLQMFLTISISYWVQSYFSWWSIVPVSFFCSIVCASGALYSFFTGLISMAILNGGMAAIIDIQNKSILSTKIIKTLSANVLSNPLYIILMTALIFGLIGGISSLSGFLLKKQIRSFFRI